MSELTRLQAEMIVQYTFQRWNMNIDPTCESGVTNKRLLTDAIQRILEENQSLPPLEPFVWYEATPENCARIPVYDDKQYSIEVAVKSDRWEGWEKVSYQYAGGDWYGYDGVYYDKGEVTDFMLIE